MPITTRGELQNHGHEDEVPLNLRSKHGAQTQLLLLLDTTLAPHSRVLSALRAAAPKLPAFAFTSLSKSVSRGITTAGIVKMMK